MNEEKAKLRLLDELQSLKILRENARSSRAPVELDQQSVGRLSRMDAMQKQNMELATEKRRQIRMQVIGSALKRIESGEFGFCVICDEEISPQRLEFDPAISCCISCMK